VRPLTLEERRQLEAHARGKLARPPMDAPWFPRGKIWKTGRGWLWSVRTRFTPGPDGTGARAGRRTSWRKRMSCRRNGPLGARYGIRGAAYGVLGGRPRATA
jgi:hypothetical protein